MSKEITVGGIAVTISTPYEAGHALTEAEARALNGVRAENVGNNVRKMITDLKTKAGEAGLSEADLAAISAKVAEYDAEYSFSTGSTGSTARVTDPLAKEANAIARNWLLAKLKEKGVSRKDYGEEKFAAKLAEVAATENVQKAAKKALADRAKQAEAFDVTID